MKFCITYASSRNISFHGSEVVEWDLGEDTDPESGNDPDKAIQLVEKDEEFRNYVLFDLLGIEWSIEVVEDES